MYIIDDKIAVIIENLSQDRKVRNIFINHNILVPRGTKVFPIYYMITKAGSLNTAVPNDVLKNGENGVLDLNFVTLTCSQYIEHVNSRNRSV